MKKQKNNIRSGTVHDEIAFLELLKERSGTRLSKIEAYLDLVNKASEQHIPKGLCKQEFTLQDNQFITTITLLADCWHWHRATVRTFIEQLEKMGKVVVTRLSKSQLIAVPLLCTTDAVSPLDKALADFRHEMREQLYEWANGTMTVSSCATLCEQLFDDAVNAFAEYRQAEKSGNKSGIMSQEEYKQTLCRIAVTCICKATFHRVMGAKEVVPESMVNFFNDDLVCDWASLLEAAKIIAELGIDGEAPSLEKEPSAIKAQFKALCRPFLAVITEEPSYTGNNAVHN